MGKNDQESSLTAAEQAQAVQKEYARESSHPTWFRQFSGDLNWEPEYLRRMRALQAALKAVTAGAPLDEAIQCGKFDSAEEFGALLEEIYRVPLDEMVACKWKLVVQEPERLELKPLSVADPGQKGWCWLQEQPQKGEALIVLRQIKNQYYNTAIGVPLREGEGASATGDGLHAVFSVAVTPDAELQQRCLETAWRFALAQWLPHSPFHEDLNRPSYEWHSRSHIDIRIPIVEDESSCAWGTQYGYRLRF